MVFDIAFGALVGRVQINNLKLFFNTVLCLNKSSSSFSPPAPPMHDLRYFIVLCHTSQLHLFSCMLEAVLYLCVHHV
jgi:hypothetical protein